MDVNLQNAIVSYRQLEIFSFLKGKTKVKKKWLKKLRRKIVSYFDTEIEFTELYKILKSVEKQGFGFYIRPMRFETKPYDDEKIVFQQVEVGMHYMGGSAYAFVDDVEFGKHTETEDLRGHNPRIIKPDDIVGISNVQLLQAIKTIDKKVYHYIFNGIVGYFSEKIEPTEEDYLIGLMSEVLKDYGVHETDYCIGGFWDDSVCLEKNENGWIVYIGERGKKHNIKNYAYGIQEACYDLLERLSDSDEMYRDLKKLLLKKLRKCI